MIAPRKIDVVFLGPNLKFAVTHSNCYVVLNFRTNEFCTNLNLIPNCSVFCHHTRDTQLKRSFLAHLFEFCDVSTRPSDPNCVFHQKRRKSSTHKRALGRVTGLPIRNCAGSSNNLVIRGTNVSAIDVTVQVCFERLYWFQDRAHLSSESTVRVLPHPHCLPNNCFSIFVQFFSDVAPHFLSAHYSSSNLAVSRYPRAIGTNQKFPRVRILRRFKKTSVPKWVFLENELLFCSILP